MTNGDYAGWRVLTNGGATDESGQYRHIDEEDIGDGTARKGTTTCVDARVVVVVAD